MQLNIRGAGGLNMLSQLRIGIEGFDRAIKSFGTSLMRRKDVREWLIEANKANLQKGLRPDNTYIEKVPKGKQKNERYEWKTILKKAANGQPYDIVTLYDEGAFYAGLSVRANAGVLEIYDTDEKTQQLLAQWGDVLGISQQQLEEFFEWIYPKFVDFVSTYKFMA